MMSELGLVYFLVKAASRKTVRVWRVSHWEHSSSLACPYLQRDLVRGWFGLLGRLYGATEELLRMRLAVQHLVGGYGAQDAL